MTVALMPRLQVMRDGESVSLTQRAAQLVVFLALQRAPVERAYIAGQLAPDLNEKRANANLRTVLWRLSSGAEGLILSEGSQLVLSPHARVDLHEKTARARQVIELNFAVDAESQGSVVALIDDLSVDLLLGWYDEWLLAAQARWRQLRMHALEALSEHLRTRGRYHEAQHAALAAAEVEPLRETPQRCMIKAHLSEGNVSEAMRVYRDFRDRLQRELSVEPSPLLAELLAVVRSS